MITCQCGKSVGLYSQCPVNGCGVEVAFCTAHGGYVRATEIMADHIKDHNAKADITEQVNPQQLR